MKLGALLLAMAPALASAFIAPALQQQPLRARSQGALRMVIEDVLKFDAKLVRALFCLSCLVWFTQSVDQMDEVQLVDRRAC